jgi:hypothetical protein
MKRIRADRKGLEGLPLQLLIMAVVAGLALVVVVGWFSGLGGTPVKNIKTISIEPSPITTSNPGINVQAKKTVDITVCAFDQGDTKVKGITVHLSGVGVDKTATDGKSTDADAAEDGCVKFNNVQVILPPGVSTSELNVEVTASEYPAKADMTPVYRS